jgi:hypothetical protein
MLHSSDHSAHCLTTLQSKLSSITPIADMSMIFSALSSKSKLAFGIHIPGTTAVQRTVSFQTPTLIFLQIDFVMFYV